MASGLTPPALDDLDAMRRALELAQRGIGLVEPNPPVGAVLLDREGHLVGEGWHQRFGGPHAEIEALQQAGPAARDGTLFVTLEPCAHTGKTPPCTQSILAAGIRRVVAATIDPAPHNSGRGVAELQKAGLTVETGLCAEQAQALIAPFAMLMTRQRPWVHAKWAMTLDGKIASRTGAARWISCTASRALVHELRGRMDAILVGIGTALADDPLLTARPPGPRTPMRIVLDSQARLPLTSQLVQSIDRAPLLVVTRPDASPQRSRSLQDAGAQLLTLPAQAPDTTPLTPLLQWLAERSCTHLLVEGGSRVLGAFHDQQLIDEVHCFIAPKLLGGADAPTAVAGEGGGDVGGPLLVNPEVRLLEGDVYIHGRVNRSGS